VLSEWSSSAEGESMNETSTCLLSADQAALWERLSVFTQATNLQLRGSLLLQVPGWMAPAMSQTASQTSSAAKICGQVSKLPAFLRI